MSRYQAHDLGARGDGLAFGVLDTETGSGTNEILARTGGEAHAHRIACALNSQDATVELAEHVIEYEQIARLYDAAMDWFPDDLWREFEASPLFAVAENWPVEAE